MRAFQFRFWRIAPFFVAAFAAAALSSSARAAGMHGGGMGGFHGSMGGGFHGGTSGGFHGGGNFHGGGCCFFGFGFSGFGWPLWPSYGYGYGYPSYPYYGAPYPYYPSQSAYPSAVAPPPETPGAYTGPARSPSSPASFAVYFATGSDRLNATAHNIIAQAATAEAHTNTQIAVAGFTDAVGNSATNLDLSRRRAESVRAALIAAGVSEHLIALVWHGEDGLKVPTANGVAEAQNRRVIIMLGAPPPPVS